MVNLDPQGIHKYLIPPHFFLMEMIQFDVHIFQMGWFNHQPEKGGLFHFFFVAGSGSFFNNHLEGPALRSWIGSHEPSPFIDDKWAMKKTLVG